MKESNYVLIVDDDPVFCRLMSHVLATFGLQSEAFTEPDKFLDRVKAVNPRLCLVDLNLGDPLRGFDILTSLQARFSTIPVFIVSGTSDGKLVAQALELGASDYLVKPVARDVLVTKLGDYLKTQELEIARPAQSAGRTVEIATHFTLSGKVVAVDELGFTILSPHLIAKGAKLGLAGKLIAELTGSSAPVTVSVLSSSVESDTGLFRTYVELPRDDSTILEKSRAWVQSQKPSLDDR